MNINLIGAAENIARVFEIAKYDNLKVKLIASEDSLVTSEDLKLFADFYGFDLQVKNPDIFAELCFGPQQVLSLFTSKRQAETLEDVIQRVESAQMEFTVVEDTLPSSGIGLLKIAIERLEFGVNDVLAVLKVAKAIAGLSGSTSIKIEYLAEAIQYRSVPTHIRRESL